MYNPETQRHWQHWAHKIHEEDLINVRDKPNVQPRDTETLAKLGAQDTRGRQTLSIIF